MTSLALTNFQMTNSVFPVDTDLEMLRHREVLYKGFVNILVSEKESHSLYNYLGFVLCIIFTIIVADTYSVLAICPA